MYIDDYAFYSLILHLIVKTDRNINNHSLNSDYHDEIVMNHQFHLISKIICTKIENTYDVKFSLQEIYEFGLLISTRAKSNEILIQNDIKQLVNEDIYNLTTSIIHSVNEYYSLNLNNDIFFNNFALHLKNLFIRIDHKIYIKNPLLTNLKSTYPFIYEIAIFIADKIRQFTQRFISEDEIAYITLHLGSQVEEMQSLTTKVNCVLLCPDFYSINKKLLTELNTRFNEDMIITHIFTSATEIKPYYETADLIITTITLPSEYLEKTYHISMFVTKPEYQKLGARIYDIAKSKSLQSFQSDIKQLFQKEHFYVMEGEMSRNEILKILSDDLVMNGYVPPEFFDECIIREKTAPTAYNEIAIPHPTMLLASQSIIAVAIHKDGITWNQNHQVKLILLLAINKDNLHSFKSIFEFIAYYTNENHNIKELLNSNDFYQFENNFLNYINVSKMNSFSK